MLSEDEIAERREVIARAPELQALLARLRERAARVIASPLEIPPY